MSLWSLVPIVLLQAVVRLLLLLFKRLITCSLAVILNLEDLMVVFSYSLYPSSSHLILLLKWYLDLRNSVKVKVNFMVLEEYFAEVSLTGVCHIMRCTLLEVGRSSF